MRRLFPATLLVCAIALVGHSADAQSSGVVRAAADSFVALSQNPALRGPWPDLTDSTRQAGVARVDRIGAQLATVRRADLSDATDQLLYDNLSEVIAAQQATRVCRNHLWTGTSTFSGWHVTASNTARTQPIGSDSARARALSSFRRIPDAIQAERSLLKRGLDSGYTASQDVIAAVVRQLDDLLPTEVTKSPLYEPARRDSSAEFRRQWAALLREVVYPAGRDYRAFLSAEYLPSARAEGSMSRQRDGVACYAASLRAQTSVHADVDSIMREARREYDVIAAQLAPLVKQLTGVSDLGGGIIMLRSDPRFTFSSRDSILPAYRAMTTVAASRIGRVVAGFSPESIVVTPYPAFQENAGLPPQYQRASADGSRTAQFMVNLSRTEMMSVANAVAHEAYPGHHLQRVAERQAQLAHPVMRSIFVGGFAEGWGIYSEVLADDMGLYSTPLLRAGYLVHLLDVTMGYYLDIGYHVKGWTRKDLVDSMVVLGGRPTRMAEAYADRHAATPGQLATYYAGYRAIRAGRQDAERALGARFRMPEFHREVLRHGTITLASLRRQVEAWIESERKGPV